MAARDQLGFGNQLPTTWNLPLPPSHFLHHGGALDNWQMQTRSAPFLTVIWERPESRLARIKKLFWPSEGKEQRVAKALEAHYADDGLRLARETWASLAEAGPEDEF